LCRFSEAEQSLIGPPAGVSKWAVDPDYDAGVSAEGGEEDSLEDLDAADGGEGDIDSLDDLIIKAGSGP
jgi:hypothetical protein